MKPTQKRSKKVNLNKIEPYHATYSLTKLDYNRILKVGMEIEYMGTYKADEHIIENPPDRTKLIEKLERVLKGTGITKITITFLSKE